MERIQLQFWPWKSQHFVNSSMSRRPCVQTLPKFSWGQIWWLTVQESLPVSRQPLGKAFSRATWEPGAEVESHGYFFWFKRSEKKMDHRLNFFNLVNLSNLLKLLNLLNLFNCSIFCQQNAMKSQVYLKLPRCNIWGWEVSGGRGCALREKSKCPSDPSTIRPWLLAHSIGSISFIGMMKFVDQIRILELNQAVQVPWNCRFLSVDVADVPFFFAPMCPECSRLCPDPVAYTVSTCGNLLLTHLDVDVTWRTWCNLKPSLLSLFGWSSLCGHSVVILWCAHFQVLHWCLCFDAEAMHPGRRISLHVGSSVICYALATRNWGGSWLLICGRNYRYILVTY